MEGYPSGTWSLRVSTSAMCAKRTEVVTRSRRTISARSRRSTASLRWDNEYSRMKHCLCERSPVPGSRTRIPVGVFLYGMGITELVPVGVGGSTSPGRISSCPWGDRRSSRSLRSLDRGHIRNRDKELVSRRKHVNEKCDDTLGFRITRAPATARARCARSSSAPLSPSSPSPPRYHAHRAPPAGGNARIEALSLRRS